MNETASLELYLPYIFLVVYYVVMFRLWLAPPPKDPLAEDKKPEGRLAASLPDQALRQVSGEPLAASRHAHAALAHVHAIDSGFDETAFLKGAMCAFETILKAYAEGDRAVLERLLDIGPASVFIATIIQREHKRQTLELILVGLNDAQIVDCETDSSIATITVRFVSEMVAATRAEDGRVIDGDAEQIVLMVDRWTFRRDLRSTNPNWKLTATRPGHRGMGHRRSGAAARIDHFL